MSRPLFTLAQEDFEEGVTGDVGADLTDPAQAENDLLSLQQAETGLADHNATTDEALQSVSTLSAQADTLETAVSDGAEITEVEAEVLQTAVEHLCARLKMPKRYRPNIATEAFGKKERRRQALQTALEGVGEGLKKIWEAILVALERAWDWIKKFFAGLFDGAVKLKNRASDMLKAIHDKKIDVNGKPIAVTKQMFDALRFEGKILEGDAQAHSAQADHDGVDLPKVAENAKNSVKRYIDLVKEAEAKPATLLDNDQNFWDKVSMILTPLLDKLSTEAKKVEGRDAIEGVSVVEYRLAESDWCLVSHQPVLVEVNAKGKTPLQRFQLLQKADVQLDLFSGAKKDAQPPKELQPMTLTQVEKLAEAVETHMGLYEKYKGSIKTIDGVFADLKKEFQSLQSKQKPGVGNNRGDMLYAMAHLSGSLNRIMTKNLTLRRGLDIRRAKARLDMCSASLSKSEGLQENKEYKGNPSGFNYKAQPPQQARLAA